VTTDAGRRARAALSRVAAEGSDPDTLVAVLAWLARPRCSPDALRRRCRDDEPGAVAGPAERVRVAAGDPDREAMEAVVAVARTWIDLGVRAAVVGDPAYPRRLAAGWPDTDGPPLLAWRGTPPGDGPAVALVGARRATGYGAGVTAWLAETVGRAGVRVVSGGAVGIDGTAHLAALESPGGTTVVLGCGHAVPYPQGHAAPGGLFDRVLDHGGTLVSELLPHQPPLPAHVRARNRIVAALADVVVVVEGGARSGALVTASAAAERGVPVLAVPGDVRAPGSAAPHRLLAEGAAPCTDPADIVGVLRGVAAGACDPTDAADADPSTPTPARAVSLPDAVHRALAEAWPRPLRVDDLALTTGLPAPVLLASLTRAQLAGEVADGPDGVRLRHAPGAR
jgi:DNA processing protein